MQAHHVAALAGVVGLAGVAACSTPAARLSSSSSSRSSSALSPRRSSLRSGSKITKGKRTTGDASGGRDPGDRDDVQQSSALLDAATLMKFRKLVMLEKKVANGRSNGGDVTKRAGDLAKVQKIEVRASVHRKQRMQRQYRG